MNRVTAAVSICLMLALAVASCTMPRPAPAQVAPADMVNTSSAATVIALSTELATERPAPTRTSTPDPAVTPPAPGEEVTPQPGDAATGPLAPSTSEPTIPVDPDAPCNRAGFIADVTIPDDSTIPPDSPFTKIWEVQNTGSCAWTPEYAVVFTGLGDQLDGQSPTPLIASGEVKPGQTTFISVAMKAPSAEGNFKGNWWLAAPDGTEFGFGSEAQSTVYVQVNVANAYSFAEQFCGAAWSTGTGRVSCQAGGASTQGAVALVSDPAMENGSIGTGLALSLTPEQVVGGYIVGRYPAIRVPPEASFHATLGCIPQSDGCYARVVLTYQMNGDAEQTLAEWNEFYNQDISEISADLKPVAGQLASFNLYVYVDGDPAVVRVLLLDPRITR